MVLCATNPNPPKPDTSSLPFHHHHHCYHFIIAIVSLLFCHHSFAIALLPFCWSHHSVAFIVVIIVVVMLPLLELLHWGHFIVVIMVSHSLSQCCICHCSVAFIIVLLLFCCYYHSVAFVRAIALGPSHSCHYGVTFIVVGPFLQQITYTVTS